MTPREETRVGDGSSGKEEVRWKFPEKVRDVESRSVTTKRVRDRRDFTGRSWTGRVKTLRSVDTGRRGTSRAQQGRVTDSQ